MNYLMRVDELEQFFTKVGELKAKGLEDNEENRLKILEEMANKRKVFRQTTEQVKKRITGKKVLRVKSK